MSKVIGIDVSKKTFDVAYLENDKWIYLSVNNSSEGFVKFIKEVGDEAHCIMEATGPYYLQLATHLYENGVNVSVINPLIIKRFSQMRLMRAKTDKKDAQLIAKYGALEQPSYWTPNDVNILKMQQIMTALEILNKQTTMLSNQLGAFESSGILDSQVKISLSSLLKNLKKQKSKLEDELDRFVQRNYFETSELLKSIPGIGPKGATILTVITNNFTKFSTYKQLIAFVGFSPRIFESGTSVKGKGHICKMGKSQVRKFLYLCSWSAKKYNKGCVEMYERLKAKGKPERVIKIALANKLLKQAFAIVKSGNQYNENHVPNPCF